MTTHTTPTSSDLQQLIAQQAELQAQIESARMATKQATLNQIKALMAQSGITMGDLMGRKGVKAAPMYKNPASDETWSGRGKPPTWFSGLLNLGYTKEQLKIAPVAQ